MRSIEEITEYMKEAGDKVWFQKNPEKEKDNMLPNAIRNGRLSNLKRIEEQYDLNRNTGLGGEWNYGYWSGVLSTLRWVLGDDKDNLDT